MDEYYQNIITNLESMLEDFHSGFGTDTINSAIIAIKELTEANKLLRQINDDLVEHQDKEIKEAVDAFASEVIDLILSRCGNPINEFQIMKIRRDMFFGEA